MTQLVKVQKTFADGTAQVVLVRESACSGDCHKCSGCGAAKETVTVIARNPIGASVGDMVHVEAASGPVLAAAAVLYIVPLAFFLAGYAIGNIWNLGALLGCLAFAVSIGLAVVYDRCVMKKRETVYTITGYPIS